MFRGDDYKEHVKCVSEDQKYGGKDFEVKTNKGDAKQQEWIQVRFLLYTDMINNCSLQPLKIQEKLYWVKPDIYFSQFPQLSFGNSLVGLFLILVRNTHLVCFESISY